MSPLDSTNGNNKNRTRFFNKEDFNPTTAGKLWDRIKIVCSQPFNKHVPFGLCFVQVHGEKDETNSPRVDILQKPSEKFSTEKKNDECDGSAGNDKDDGKNKNKDDEDDIKIGSFFKRKKTREKSLEGTKPSGSPGT